MVERNGQAQVADTEDRNPFDIARDELGDDEYAGEDTEGAGELDATENAPEPSDDAAPDQQDTLTSTDPLPENATPEDIHKHWQRAFTRARQADRASQKEMANQHQQYHEMFTRFYQDEGYARQVIAQRFPHLAGQLTGTEQPPGPQPPSTGTGITALLQQGLGEYGFLASAIGPAIEQVIAQQVQQRVAPLEQRTTQQVKQQRDREETELKSALDGQFPGWEEQFGAQMRELDDFILSDQLHHPKYGSKYELYYKLLNPGAERVRVAREMQQAPQRRSGISQTARTSRPNIMETVRKADSNHDAFRAAVQGALQELPDPRT